ncbi:hypothetical protein FOL47_002086 [Perkinsus chesapeaki]|uniref:Uncharacterized protein n=1 Tax=Perkinsus chesapeaki TaxID=330153 RepID=A0A7J6MFY4_PERCH|nr:hypothetical protein FOL47_002086 [Perkinsus chesapeaki]
MALAVLGILRPSLWQLPAVGGLLSAAVGQSRGMKVRVKQRRSHKGRLLQHHQTHYVPKSHKTLVDYTLQAEDLCVAILLVKSDRRPQSVCHVTVCGIIKELPDTSSLYSRWIRELIKELPCLGSDFPEFYRKTPYRCQTPYSIPAGLVPGVLGKLREDLPAGNWKEADVTPNMRISPCFGKSKGRIDEDNDDVVWLLVDLRMLNTTVEIPERFRHNA